MPMHEHVGTRRLAAGSPLLAASRKILIEVADDQRAAPFKTARACVSPRCNIGQQRCNSPQDSNGIVYSSAFNCRPSSAPTLDPWGRLDLLLQLR